MAIISGTIISRPAAHTYPLAGPDLPISIATLESPSFLRNAASQSQSAERPNPPAPKLASNNSAAEKRRTSADFHP
jgi:hypothetical protein